MNIAIFDFCETLVNFQTADRFCRFVLEKKSKKRIILFDQFLNRFKIYALFTRLGVKNFQKRFLLFGLKSLKVSEIETIAKEFLKVEIEPRLNLEVYTLFKKHLKYGDFVIINSGGYEPYIKAFSEKYQVNKFYATQLGFKGNYLTGMIHGVDCLGTEKVRRMTNDGFSKQANDEVYVYSDSATDMPIFNLATKKYAVISRAQIPQWATNNFEIIKV